MATVSFRKEIALDGTNAAEVSTPLGNAHRLGIWLSNSGAATVSSLAVWGRVTEQSPWFPVATVSGDYSSEKPVVAWVEGSPFSLVAAETAAIGLEVGWFSDIKVQATAAAPTTLVVAFHGA